MTAVPFSQRLLMRLAAQYVFAIACLDAILFGVAGRLDWPAAWWMTLTFAIPLAFGAPWLVRHDPQLLQERMRPGVDNVPRWDRLLIRVYRLVLLPLLFIVAALDAGRFQWSHMPTWVQVIGFAFVVFAIRGIWWCTAANRFLARWARIQSDRGQTVVREGPYRYVRHPMYTSLIALMIGIALFLGSWLALMPAALIGVVFIVRTILEDRMLVQGLDGYHSYARMVPKRLVPGIW